MLLAHAAKHDSGSLYPLPETLTGAARATKAIVALIKLGMADEREVTDTAEVSRTEEDQRYGTFLTDAGCAAISLDAGERSAEEPAEPAPAPAKAPSKSSTVLALLSRKQGATLPELIEATGSLPHTTRAALTGLRKKGHAIERGKRGDVTCYTVQAVAA